MSGRRVVFMGVPVPRVHPGPSPLELEVVAFDRHGYVYLDARAASWREAKRRGARFLREDHVGHVTIALRRGRRGDRWDVRLARGQGETHWQRVARVELVEVDE